jgi:hypothetical protein
MRTDDQIEKKRKKENSEKLCKKFEGKRTDVWMFG